MRRPAKHDETVPYKCGHEEVMPSSYIAAPRTVNRDWICPYCVREASTRLATIVVPEVLSGKRKISRHRYKSDYDPGWVISPEMSREEAGILREAQLHHGAAREWLAARGVVCPVLAPDPLQPDAWADRAVEDHAAGAEILATLDEILAPRLDAYWASLTAWEEQNQQRELAEGWHKGECVECGRATSIRANGMCGQCD